MQDITKIDPISVAEILPGKDIPKYATKIWRRSPEIKYQHKGPAKNALHYHWPNQRWNQRVKIVLYKYDFDTNRYVSIFDSDSPLADLVFDGEINLKDALDSLEW